MDIVVAREVLRNLVKGAQKVGYYSGRNPEMVKNAGKNAAVF